MVGAECIAESVEKLSDRKAKYLLENGVDGVGDSLDGEEITEEDFDVLLGQANTLVEKYQHLEPSEYEPEDHALLYCMSNIFQDYDERSDSIPTDIDELYEEKFDGTGPFFDLQVGLVYFPEELLDLIPESPEWPIFSDN